MVNVNIDDDLYEQIVKKVEERQKKKPFMIHTLRAWVQEAIFEKLKRR